MEGAGAGNPCCAGCEEKKVGEDSESEKGKMRVRLCCVQYQEGRRPEGGRVERSERKCEIYKKLRDETLVCLSFCSELLFFSSRDDLVSELWGWKEKYWDTLEKHIGCHYLIMSLTFPDALDSLLWKCHYLQVKFSISPQVFKFLCPFH